MAFGNNKVSSSYDSHDDDDDDDDDVEAFVMKLHNSLKEFIVKNKELKIKINDV